MNVDSEPVGETRENISLKTGTKKKQWFSCSCKDNCFGGSKIVIISFACLTVAITISLIIQIYYGDYQIIPHGSVATDSTDCSLIGLDVLKKNGNAVDAAIASMICLAVVNPHTTSLDGHGMLMIYSHRTRLPPEIIDFNQEGVMQSENLPMTRLLTGLAYAHLKFGKTPWKSLVTPAANLASQGFKVSSPFAQAVNKFKMELLYPTVLAGKTITFNSLGSFLHRIADISENELEEYISDKGFQILKPIKTTFYNHNIYVPDNPTIGPFLLENLESIGNLNFSQNDVSKPEFVYHIAKLLQKLYSDAEIDEKFHEGTSSNVASMDTDDLYVSGTTGLSDWFGTREITPYGYILDSNSTFTLLNTRIPVIISDKNYICGRRIILGASGISIATQIIANLLLGAENGASSVETPRFQIINRDIIGIENGRNVNFNDAVKVYLGTLAKLESLSEPYNTCNIVEKIQDDLSAHSDSRSESVAYRF